MKITISQEGASPIEVNIADDKSKPLLLLLHCDTKSSDAKKYLAAAGNNIIPVVTLNNIVQYYPTKTQYAINEPFPLTNFKKLMSKLIASEVYYSGEKTKCTESDFVSWLKNPNNQWIVIPTDDYKDLKAIARLEYSNRLKSTFLSCLFVDEPYRGKGLAGQLINYAKYKSVTCRSGYCRVSLRVYDTNGPALKLYGKYGFDL